MARAAGTPQQSLPEESVIDVLLRQHQLIRAGFSRVQASTGARRQIEFSRLRTLLAAHETAEEMVLRPVSSQTAGPEVAAARNAEEKEANRTLSLLDSLDVCGVEFDTLFRQFEMAIVEHQEREEADEFPSVRAGRPAAELVAMGRILLAVEKIAPGAECGSRSAAAIG